MGNNVIFKLVAMVYLLINIVASLNSSTDEYALLAFKSQITSDPNKILAKNWSQGTSFCNWIGITCGRRHQRVRGLNLTDMGLGGTIAKEIGELSFLRSLIISNNNFHGFIPNEICKLSQLQEIEMQNNGLTGSIPPTFEFLQNLLKLNISQNGLTGNIPNGIFNLTSLIEISFRNNSLSGSLPMDICSNLPKLETLRISVNQLSGNIPPSLGACMNLKLLSLSYNNFAGSIPMEIGKLSKLQVLYLRVNKLSGNIPKEIGNLSALAHLALGPNSLTEYGSNGLVSTMADIYSYGIMLMETFTKKKPTDDMFVGEFTMRKWVFESFPDATVQMVDVDLVNAAEDNIRAKESYFTLIMELALECTTDLPEERPTAKDVLTRLKKINT